MTRPEQTGPLSVCCIERVIESGPHRAVIDLFPGSGPLQVGTLIADVERVYRVDRILVSETPYAGSRVLTTVVQESP